MNKRKTIALLGISFVITLIVILGILFAQENEGSDLSYLNNNYEPYYVLTANGDQARRQGNFDMAFSFYQKSISINPKNPYPYIWMAFMYNQEKLIIPAINEIENAKKYKEFLEFYFVKGDKNNSDLYNLHMLESYIYFNKNEIDKAIEILLKDVLLIDEILLIEDKTNENKIKRYSINNQSVLFNDTSLFSLDDKYLPIFGDAYIILLYLKYNRGDLNIIEDIEKTINIQVLVDKNYKADLIAYLFLKKIEEEQNKTQDYERYIRKYEGLINYKDDLVKYEQLLQNPYIIHDFDAY